MADIHALIVKAARQAGVPVKLFASLILNGERSWQGWQTSPAGAQGPAQLMPGTASGLSRQHGIDTSTYYGNLLGGAFYLKEQLQRFGGNPRKAVAAYNAGPNAVASGRIPSSTQDYVSKVLSGTGSLGAQVPAEGAVAAPVAARAPQGYRTVAGPTRMSLVSPAPPDVTGLLEEGLGNIAQGFRPTETLKLVAPSILQQWLQPSTLKETRTSTRVPVIAPLAPGQAHPPSVSATGLSSVSPIRGQVIGLPYQGTHAKAFNVSGGSDNWESENALDIRAPVGTPIRAVSDGVIGPQFGSLGSGGRFAGLRLHLVTNGNEYYYAHLSRFAPGIKPGTRVKAGQIIGYSGEANGVPHLHFASKTGDPRKHTRRR